MRGQLKPDSRSEYLRVIDDLVRMGAEGVVLGCTEIPLLVHQKDVPVPLLDTAVIHAEAALEEALIW